MPFDIVAMEFTLLEKYSKGFENILVGTDVLSKFTIAVATRDPNASTVAKVLVEKWFTYFGVPQRPHSD